MLLISNLIKEFPEACRRGLISLDDEPASRVISALDRIQDHYDLVLTKAERAMEFVHERLAEMIGEIKRIAMQEED